MSPASRSTLNPAAYLREHLPVFLEPPLPGPVLDLACGEGHNGVFLASRGLQVVCCDRSSEALENTRRLAEDHGVTVGLRQVDLEQEGIHPLPVEGYGGMLIFRYLHRPLFPDIRAALKPGGVLIYETFTVGQARFGRPTNPDFLLNPGELHGWFEDWDTLDAFEGLQRGPDRAIARILCRKPKTLEKPKR